MWRVTSGCVCMCGRVRVAALRDPGKVGLWASNVTVSSGSFRLCGLVGGYGVGSLVLETSDWAPKPPSALSLSWLPPNLSWAG